MNCQGKCKDCGFWRDCFTPVDVIGSEKWGECDLATMRNGQARHPQTSLVANGVRFGTMNCDLYTLESFGCNQFRERRGHEFVRLVEEAYRAVDEEYDDVARKPRGVAFAILTLLDGSGEHWSGESGYRVCVEEDGVWKIVEFQHHDLDSGK